MKAGQNSIDVSYALMNLGNADYSGRFWVVNAIYPGKAAGMNYSFPYGKFSENEFDSAGTPQITRASFTPGVKGIGNTFVTPVRGWGSAVSNTGTGAAFTVEYPFLECFYSYQPPEGLPPTFEWMYVFINLKPFAEGIKEAASRPEVSDLLEQYIFRTRWQMIPISGMETVTGVAEGIVCSIVPGETGVKTVLLSDRETIHNAFFDRRFQR